MSKLFKPLADFRDNYRSDPGIFWKWFILTILIGNVGFWVPLISLLRSGSNDILLKVVLSGNVSTFCIVALADILGYYEIQKRKDIPVSKGFPAVITGLLVTNAVIYAMTLGSKLRFDLILVGSISIFTLLIIVFSFAYRDIETIDDVRELAKDDNRRVETSDANLPETAYVNPVPPQIQ